MDQCYALFLNNAQPEFTATYLYISNTNSIRWAVLTAFLTHTEHQTFGS